MRSVTVSVPASVTNLGAGFDTLGLAVSVRNRITVIERGSGLSIAVAGEGKEVLPTGRSNLVYRAMSAVFTQVGRRPRGLHIRLTNEIPIGRGMGSSAASIVGAMAAANQLTGGKLSACKLLEMAVRLEGHPDNVLPALVGGFTISAVDGARVYFVRKTLPAHVHMVLVTPDAEICTREARAVLPKRVPFRDAVFNVSRSSLTVAALAEGNLDLLGVGMRDRLHESYRRKLFPKLTRFLDVLARSGGNGIAVSGSGPTVITFVDGKREAHKVAGRACRALRRLKLKASVRVLGGSVDGVRIHRGKR